VAADSEKHGDPAGSGQPFPGVNLRRFPMLSPPGERPQDRKSQQRSNTMAIRIVAIPGSVRPGNYTAMALNLVMDEFTKHPEIEAERIELEALELPPPGLRPDAPGPALSLGSISICL